MISEIKILIAEDVPYDAELVMKEIRRGGISFRHRIVDTPDDYIRELRDFEPDIILSDYSMPTFNGMQALEYKNELTPLVPFILVTGALNEQTAVEVMKAGADDYLIKERLKRLVPAIKNALEQGRIRRKNAEAEIALRESEIHFRTLADCGRALIWIAGPDGMVTYFNEPWLNFTGRSLDLELGMGWTAGIHPDDAPRRAGICAEKFKTHEKFSIEYRILNASGEYRWIQDDATPRFNSKHEFLGFMGHCLDITMHKISEEQITKYNDQLRGLTAHLERIREQERLTIARDIHDVLGSSLSSLKMEMKILQTSIDSQCPSLHEELLGQARRMSGLVDESIDLMRRTLKELRPEILEELGLSEAIRWYSKEIGHRSGIDFLVTIFPKEIKLNQIQSVILFRIFQEILTNITQHSGATKVTVFFKKNRNILVMSVGDNGIGITPEQTSRNDAFGILGMRERAFLLSGEIQITGVPGQGTTIRLTIPISP
jgi:PAS domain S-box-containing protein